MEESFHIGNHPWEEILLLAKDHGWKPLECDSENWERLYFSSDGHFVSSYDAFQLAQTLRRVKQWQNALDQEFLNTIATFLEKGDFSIC
ncbi:MAG: hypothetical protein SFU91_10160 [Chloroherpetonaceae bacterium]|nr:hypothetical protein [Chloroherpetonaceae bacterium]